MRDLHWKNVTCKANSRNVWIIKIWVFGISRGECLFYTVFGHLEKLTPIYWGVFVITTRNPKEPDILHQSFNRLCFFMDIILMEHIMMIFLFEFDCQP